MPRNVRNFWVDVNVDGKERRVATGPRTKAGGMDVSLYIRHNGSVADLADVMCRVRGDRLIATFRFADGTEKVVETIR